MSTHRYAVSEVEDEHGNTCWAVEDENGEWPLPPFGSHLLAVELCRRLNEQKEDS